VGVRVFLRVRRIERGLIITTDEPIFTQIAPSAALADESTFVAYMNRLLPQLSGPFQADGLTVLGYGSQSQAGFQRVDPRAPTQVPHELRRAIAARLSGAMTVDNALDIFMHVTSHSGMGRFACMCQCVCVLSVCQSQQPVWLGSCVTIQRYVCGSAGLSRPGMSRPQKATLMVTLPNMLDVLRRPPAPIPSRETMDRKNARRVAFRQLLIRAVLYFTTAQSVVEARRTHPNWPGSPVPFDVPLVMEQAAYLIQRVLSALDRLDQDNYDQSLPDIEPLGSLIHPGACVCWRHGVCVGVCVMASRECMMAATAWGGGRGGWGYESFCVCVCGYVCV
jgi:hypothetical protein